MMRIESAVEVQVGAVVLQGDLTVCLWYRDFEQTTDEEARALVDRAERER